MRQGKHFSVAWLCKEKWVERKIWSRWTENKHGSHGQIFPPQTTEIERKSALVLWFPNLKMKIYYIKFKKNYIINPNFNIIIL